MTGVLRVLCVDDDPEALELTEAFLERELPGGEVVTATSGQEGLAVLDAEPVHCVVSDYDMSGGNGLDLLRAARERDPDLPFILFTGKGSEEVASEAVSTGVTDYLQKAGPEQFELLANRVENAVDQYRAEQNLAATYGKLEGLHDSALELRQVDDRETAYDRALSAAVEVLSFDVCGFFRVTDGVFVPAASSNPEVYIEDIPTDEGLIGQAYQTGDPSLVDDVTESEIARGDDPDYLSCLTVPVGDHGVLQAVAAEPGFFDPDDLELAELLVAHLAATLDRIGYEADIRETRRKVEQLHDISLELRDADDRDAVFERATGAAKEVLAFDTCGFFVEADGRLLPAHLENVPPEFEPLDRDEGILGKTFRSGESFLVDDVTEAPEAVPLREAYRACLSVPVGDHGVFQAISAEPGFFDERDLELAELLVSHVAGTLDRIAYETDLEATNSQLETVLANTTANIYIKDLDGRYTLVNDAFAENLGMPRDHIVGRTDEEVQDPEVAAEVRANDQLAIEERRPVEVEESAGWDENERVYYSVKVPLFDDDGEPTGVCGVSSDITALKDHQRELERKTERLEEFASVVSHDLRNPLTVAQGYAEMLDGDDEAVTELQVSLARMEEIIEDLLTLARTGRQVGETEPVDLTAVAKDAWATVDTDGATLVVDCDLTVEADASRLAQAFENLFRNAVEHGSTSPGSQARQDAVEHGSTSPQQAGDAVEHGGPEVTVRLERTDEGFAVADDGDGLPDEENLLDVGVSTKTSGTGVGLSIVDRIATAHGWELSACNGEDGARFEFAI